MALPLRSDQVVKVVFFFAIFTCKYGLTASINSDVVLQLKDGALKMQNEMQSLIVKNLGYDILQNSFAKISESSTNFDHSSTVDKFVEDISRKTKIAKDVLSELSTHILNDYNTNNEDGEVRSIESCCKFDKSKLRFNSIFGEWISLENMCEQTPEANVNICPSLGKSNSKSRLLKRSSLLSKLKDIYNSEAAGEGRYIYFGSLDGYTVTYPAYKDARDECTCAQSDPRISSWMTEALPSPKGRHFVIVFDYSESIQVDSLLSLARKVGKVLLSMINSNDKILVKFYHNEDLLEAGLAQCFRVSSKADPDLKEQILIAIDNKKPSGITASYTKIFKESFEALEREIDAERARHFIFVTSGLYTEHSSEVEESFRMARRNLGCDVSIHLVLLNDESLPNTNFITNKALPEIGCPSQDRNFIEIKPEDDNFTIISKLSAIYSAINISNYDGNVRYLMPHSDRLKRGTTIDACQPIVNNKEAQNNNIINNVLIGVACISFLTSEFIREDWSNTENSYWFLVKQNGQTMIHPKFGQPLGTDEGSRTIHISNFESASLFENGSKLFLNNSGSETHSVLKSISRGYFGATSQNRSFRYSWKKVPDSSFILIIATLEDYQNSQLYVAGLGGVERYHRLDLWNDPTLYQRHLCADSQNQVSVKDLSTIKFPPDAFMQPSIYYLSETTAFVKRLDQLFTPGNEELPPPRFFKNNDVFKSLRRSVQSTHLMDKFWMDDKSDETVNIVARYIAMEDGFFRMMPGALLNPVYDPRIRAWYRLMKNQPGITLTTPYEDAFSRGVVMSLGKVFYRGKTSKEKAGNIVLDFTLQYFQVMLEKSLPCSGSNKDCVVIDRNGFVVYAKEFLDKSYDGAFENQHIIKVRKRVGKSLIQRRIMKKNFCAEFSNNQTIKEWFYSLDHVVKPVSVTEGCLQYNIVPIEETNVLLLSIINACSNDVNECICSQPEDGERLGYCTSEVDTDNCECPCIQRVTCLSDFPISANTLKCTPEEKSTTTFSQTWYKGDVSKLPLCRDPGCKKFQASSQCGRLGCKWCFQYPNKTMAPDNQKYCEYEAEECFPAPQINKPSIDENKDGFHLVPHGIGLIAAIILCIGVACGLYCRRGRLENKETKISVKSRSPSSSADAVNANYAPGSSAFIKKLTGGSSSSPRKKGEKLPPSSTINLPDLSTAYENRNYNADVFVC